MNLLARFGAAMMAMAGERTAPGPDDDYWYDQRSSMSAAGQPVTVDSATQIATAYTCGRVLSEAIASLPIHVTRTLPNGDTESLDDGRKLPATLAGLPRLLRLSPNSLQTSFRWRETGMWDVTFRGNTYNRIRIGSAGLVTALEPLHPDRILPVLKDGRAHYEYRPERGPLEVLLADEVLHVRGLSDDGFKGLSPIAKQRDTLGAAIAASDYGSRFFRNDVRPSIHFKHPGKLSDPAYDRLKRELQSAYGGVNRFKPAILEDGMDIARVSITNEEAQFLETRRLSREEICSIFRVPQHLAGILDRATFSNIEQMGLYFVVYTLIPYCVRWEQEINAHPALLGGIDDIRVAFNLDGLLRGDLRSRYEAYAIGRNWGWLSANDARRREGMNSIGPEGDSYLQPANMNRAGTVGGNPRPERTDPRDDGQEREDAAAEVTSA